MCPHRQSMVIYYDVAKHIFMSNRLINCQPEKNDDNIPSSHRTRRWQVGQVEQLERVLVEVLLRNADPLSILRFADSEIQRKVLRGELVRSNRIHWSVICKLSYTVNWKTFSLMRFVVFFYSPFQGSTTETRPCSGSISNIWEYFFGRKTFGAINSSEIMEEVGPNCQCGCIIHLLKSKPRRMLASSSQACVGLENAMWTIQVG